MCYFGMLLKLGTNEIGNGGKLIPQRFTRLVKTEPLMDHFRGDFPCLFSSHTPPLIPSVETSLKSSNYIAVWRMNSCNMNPAS